jgi:hypothetical protein
MSFMNKLPCALCHEDKKLQDSHIIPNSVFRRIKNAGDGGSLILFDDNPDSLVRRSQDSWSEHLLCSSCEAVISNYEKTGLEVLRGVNPYRISERSDGVVLGGHEHRLFKLFLISLLWRAAVSNLPQFAKVVLPLHCEQQARTALLGEKPLHSRRLGCRISRLTDPTPSDGGRFSPESLRQLIVSPIPRLDDKLEHYSYLFILEGYALELFVPNIPLRLSSHPGTYRDGTTFFVPFLSVFDIPELLALMVSAYGKNEQGKVTFKSKRR